jgi:hypothetical protein
MVRSYTKIAKILVIRHEVFTRTHCAIRERTGPVLDNPWHVLDPISHVITKVKCTFVVTVQFIYGAVDGRKGEEMIPLCPLRIVLMISWI